VSVPGPLPASVRVRSGFGLLMLSTEVVQGSSGGWGWLVWSLDWFSGSKFLLFRTMVVFVE
jgi:hypothetical protein